MNMQEVFDKVVSHLATQGQQSVDCDGQSCLYRGPRGLKCAAGVLIPEDQYSPDMETKGWCNVGPIVNKNLYGSRRSPTELSKLVSNLQVAHDHSKDGLDLIIELVRAASRYGLNDISVHMLRAELAEFKCNP